MEQQAEYGQTRIFEPSARKDQIEFKLYLGQSMNLPDGTQRAVDKNDLRSFLRSVAEPNLKNYTIMQAVGAWEGIEEFTIIIIHIGTIEDCLVVEYVGQMYKRQFLQAEVLMTETKIVAVTI